MIFLGRIDKKIDFPVIMHYKYRLRYGSTRRIKSKNILVRFPSGCGFKYPVPQLRYQAIENDSSAGFLESGTYYGKGQSRFGVNSACFFGLT